MVRIRSSASVTEAATERIRADLLAGRYPAGERLKISELCETLGYNLSAVREALSRLLPEGLITFEPNCGYCVAPVHAEELRDLTATRIEIETSCLRRAIALGGLNGETGVVAALHRLLHTPKAAPGSEPAAQEPWSEAHRLFHEALVASCESPWRLRLRAQLYTHSERYRRFAARPSRGERDVDAEHRALADATLARDADRAAALLPAHFESTAHYVLASVDNGSLGRRA
jgi:GntR family carbon starvation induced transcriptional regulator